MLISFLHRYSRTFTAAMLMAVIVLFNSCSAGKKVKISNYANLVSCHQVNTFDFKRVNPQPLHQLSLDTVLSNHFSLSSLNIANAFGFLDLLKQYVEIQNTYNVHPTTEQRLQKLELAMKLSERINQASLEISSFASELDCEEERITQVADFLKGKEKQRETRLTVAAIGVGAIGGVASGILSASEKAGNSGDYLGIATGITEAVLGLLILKNNKTTELLHPRNALKDIWYGNPASDIYPSSIWYYLNYKKPADSSGLSLREKIIERWKGFEQIDASSKEDLKDFELLYLGEAGKYGTEELYNRAKMYDQIESYVKMIKQDLTTLSLEAGLQ
ncbi:MAG TPA: hypothetical protein PKE30_02380 [Niabella sp.]|nr:hypothetical protein [Niabella sp.]